MDFHPVLVILKDHSFIPEVITASWKQGTNVRVTFQNEDDYPHYLECRDNVDFPGIRLDPGHAVTYGFDNAGRFEVTSKENGFMKCILDFPEEEGDIRRSLSKAKSSDNSVAVKATSSIRLCTSPSLVNTVDCGHSDYDDASGVVTPSRDGSSRGGDDTQEGYESDDFQDHHLEDDEVVGENIAHAVLGRPSDGGSGQPVFSPSRGVLSGERRSAQEQYPFPSLPSASPASPLSPEDGRGGDADGAFDETEGSSALCSPIFFGNSMSAYTASGAVRSEEGPDQKLRSRQKRSAYAGYDEALTFCEDEEDGADDEDELDGMHAQRLQLKSKSMASQQRHGHGGAAVQSRSVWGSSSREVLAGVDAVPSPGLEPEKPVKGSNSKLAGKSEMTRGAIAGRTATKPPSMYNVVPIRFRQRRFVVIRDYDFQFKQISHFVNAPLEFRLHADVPLHVEHELVGVSSNPNLCFESPLLQQMQNGAYQFIPPCAGEIHVSCKVYTDMHCIIQVYDPKDINSLASIASNSEQARGAGAGKNVVPYGASVPPPLFGSVGARPSPAFAARSASPSMPALRGSSTPPQTPPRARQVGSSVDRSPGSAGRERKEAFLGTGEKLYILPQGFSNSFNVHSSANSISSRSTTSFFDSDDEYSLLGANDRQSAHSFTPKRVNGENVDDDAQSVESTRSEELRLPVYDQDKLNAALLPANTTRVLIENFTFRPSSISILENQFIAFVAHSNDKHQLSCVRLQSFATALSGIGKKKNEGAAPYTVPSVEEGGSNSITLINPGNSDSTDRGAVGDVLFDIKLEGYGKYYLYQFLVPGRYCIKDEIFQFMSCTVTVLEQPADDLDTEPIDPGADCVYGFTEDLLGLEQRPGLDDDAGGHEDSASDDEVLAQEEFERQRRSFKADHRRMYKNLVVPTSLGQDEVDCIGAAAAPHSGSGLGPSSPKINLQQVLSPSLDLNEEQRRYIEKKYGTSSSKKLMKAHGGDDVDRDGARFGPGSNGSGGSVTTKMNLMGSFAQPMKGHTISPSGRLVHSAMADSAHSLDGSGSDVDESDDNYEKDMIFDMEDEEGEGEDAEYRESKHIHGYSELTDDDGPAPAWCEPSPSRKAVSGSAPKYPIVDVYYNDASPHKANGSAADPSSNSKYNRAAARHLAASNRAADNMNLIITDMEDEYGGEYNDDEFESVDPPPYTRLDDDGGDGTVTGSQRPYNESECTKDSNFMSGFQNWYLQEQKKGAAQGIVKEQDSDEEEDVAVESALGSWWKNDRANAAGERATFAEKIPLMASKEQSLDLLTRSLQQVGHLTSGMDHLHERISKYGTSKQPVVASASDGAASALNKSGASLLQNPSFSSRNRRNLDASKTPTKPTSSSEADAMARYYELYTKGIEEIEMKNLKSFDAKISKGLKDRDKTGPTAAPADATGDARMDVIAEGSDEEGASSGKLSQGQKKKRRLAKLKAAKMAGLVTEGGPEPMDVETDASAPVQAAPVKGMTLPKPGSASIVQQQRSASSVDPTASQSVSDASDAIIFNMLTSAAPATKSAPIPIPIPVPPSRPLSETAVTHRVSSASTLTTTTASTQQASDFSGASVMVNSVVTTTLVSTGDGEDGTELTGKARKKALKKMKRNKKADTGAEDVGASAAPSAGGVDASEQVVVVDEEEGYDESGVSADVITRTGSLYFDKQEEAAVVEPEAVAPVKSADVPDPVLVIEAGKDSAEPCAPVVVKTIVPVTLPKATTVAKIAPPALIAPAKGEPPAKATAKPDSKAVVTKVEAPAKVLSKGAVSAKGALKTEQAVKQHTVKEAALKPALKPAAKPEAPVKTLTVPRVIPGMPVAISVDGKNKNVIGSFGKASTPAVPEAAKEKKAKSVDAPLVESASSKTQKSGPGTAAAKSPAAEPIVAEPVHMKILAVDTSAKTAVEASAVPESSKAQKSKADPLAAEPVKTSRAKGGDVATKTTKETGVAEPVKVPAANKASTIAPAVADTVPAKQKKERADEPSPVAPVEIPSPTADSATVSEEKLTNRERKLLRKQQKQAALEAETTASASESTVPPVEKENPVVLPPSSVVTTAVDVPVSVPVSEQPADRVPTKSAKHVRLNDSPAGIDVTVQAAEQTAPAALSTSHVAEPPAQSSAAPVPVVSPVRVAAREGSVAAKEKTSPVPKLKETFSDINSKIKARLEENRLEMFFMQRWSSVQELMALAVEEVATCGIYSVCGTDTLHSGTPVPIVIVSGSNVAPDDADADVDTDLEPPPPEWEPPKPEPASRSKRANRTSISDEHAVPAAAPAVAAGKKSGSRRSRRK